MSLDQYVKSRVIGKGSYGEVWLAKHKKDKKQYVLKKLDMKNASTREKKAAEQEAKLLSKLKHPNICSYKDSFEGGDGFLYIAMGFCEGGDLYNKLKESRGTLLEERQVVEWFVQIAMALQYMHERNILHRDLKTQNIFLTKSKIIKVGDLGIARVLESSSDMATTLIGTPYYMSPELFSNKPYNGKSDVWALGCCVYEMTTLKHAFNAKDMNSLVYKILRGKMPLMPKTYSAELVNLIKAMLNQNPDKRPSVNRILRDPYIKKNIAIFLEGTKKSRRPSTPGTPSSRPTTAESRREDVVDSVAARKVQKSEAEKRRERERERQRVQSKPVVVIEENLEPLNFGPDLAPIQEELEASGGSQKSAVSAARAERAKYKPSLQKTPEINVHAASPEVKISGDNAYFSKPQRSNSPRSRSPRPRSPRSRSPRASSPKTVASQDGHSRSRDSGDSSNKSADKYNSNHDAQKHRFSPNLEPNLRRFSSGRSSSETERKEQNEHVADSAHNSNTDKPKIKKKKVPTATLR